MSENILLIGFSMCDNSMANSLEKKPERIAYSISLQTFLFKAKEESCLYIPEGLYHFWGLIVRNLSY